MTTSSAFTLRGGHVFAGLLLFFAAIIAINIAFAVAAVRTFPGEDERRSYTQGLHYNDVLATRRAQAELGWIARSEFTRAGRGAVLLVRLHERSGEPIEGANVSGVLRWPPNESGDRAVAFVAQGEGVYAADLGAISPGRWDLRARAESEGSGALDFEAELTWP
jgi:nitrogen fixation protein FixH